MDDWDRRARAAAVLAGIHYERVAASLGISTQTLDRKLAPQKTALKKREQQAAAHAVADACGIPYEFFTADLSKLSGEMPGEQVNRIDVMVEDIKAIRDEMVAARDRAAARVSRRGENSGLENH